MTPTQYVKTLTRRMQLQEKWLRQNGVLDDEEYSEMTELDLEISSWPEDWQGERGYGHGLKRLMKELGVEAREA